MTLRASLFPHVDAKPRGDALSISSTANPCPIIVSAQALYVLEMVPDIPMPLQPWRKIMAGNGPMPLGFLKKARSSVFPSKLEKLTGASSLPAPAGAAALIIATRAAKAARKWDATRIMPHRSTTTLPITFGIECYRRIFSRKSSTSRLRTDEF